MSDSSTEVGGKRNSEALEETVGVGFTGRIKGTFVKTREWLYSLADVLQSTPITPSIDSIVSVVVALIANWRAAVPSVDIQIERFSSGEEDQ